MSRPGTEMRIIVHPHTRQPKPKILRGIGVGIWRFTVGRWRLQALPAWICVSAAFLRWWPIWLAATGVFMLATRVIGDKEARLPVGQQHPGVSARECTLAATTFGAIAAWWFLVATGPYLGESLGPWPAITAAGTGCFIWWYGRRARPLSWLQTQWALTVAHEIPALNGSTLHDEELDEDGSPLSATVHLKPGALASDAERAATTEHLESILALNRGTAELKHVPGMPPTVLKLRLVPLPERRQVRYWDGPTLTDDGRYVIGVTPTGDTVYARRWSPDGGFHMLISGGTGAGKSGAMNTVGLESVLSEHVYPIGVDGKYGAGFPALRDGMAVYADAAWTWGITVRAVREIMEIRGGRYSRERRNGWSPDIDPLIELWIDELPQVMKRHPQVDGDLADLASQGRSLGVAIILATQTVSAMAMTRRGQWPTTRGNISMGTRWIGPGGDTGQNNISGGSNNIKQLLERLPAGPGWAVIAGRSTDTPPMIARTLWAPCEDEVKRGHEAPHGTVEDWIREYRVFPDLHPEDQAVIDRIRAKIAAGPEQPEQVEASPARPAITAADTSSVTSRTVVSAPVDTDVRARVLGIIQEHPEGLRVGDIATKAGCAPRSANLALSALLAEEKVHQPGGPRTVWLPVSASAAGRVPSQTSAPAVSAQQRPDIRDKVLAVLRDCPEGMQMGQIATRVGCPPRWVADCLAALLKEERVAAADGSPKVWRLVQAPTV